MLFKKALGLRQRCFRSDFSKVADGKWPLIAFNYVNNIGNFIHTYIRGVTKQSNEVTSNEVTRNRVTGKKFQGSKILKSFKNM